VAGLGVVLALLLASMQAPGCGSGGSGGASGGAGASQADGGTLQAGGAGAGPVDAGAQDAGDAAACPDAAGTLTLYVIPPPASLDWTTPNTLFGSVAQSSLAGQAMVLAGDAVSSHAIGHVHLALDCGDLSIALTGQTGSGGEWMSAGDGFGVVFRTFPGAMNDTVEGGNADAIADIAARQQSGNLSQVAFTVNQPMCQRLRSFYDAYLQSGAYLSFCALDRPRRFEGAGCAIFGAGMVDVGGLLRRSLFTPVWARTLIVGSARFANTAGSEPYFAYGSNLVARQGDATLIWPAGVNVPASTVTPIVPGAAVLDRWTGAEDLPFNVPDLPASVASAVPFTIYDPELIANWAEGVWAQASQAGTVDSLGASWTADTVGAVHQVSYDAHCVMPQSIAFDADNDDLFKDSDEP
jgi:hypothetical protein